MTQYIVIYDKEGNIINQYGFDGEISVPIGIPYILLTGQLAMQAMSFGPIERVDVSEEPHKVVYGTNQMDYKISEMDLESYQNYRQMENTCECERFLKEYLLEWKDGKKYEITKEAISDMILNKQIYDIRQASGETEFPLLWHAYHENSRNFTEEEYNELLTAICRFVHPYLQKEIMYTEVIYSQTDKEMVKNINIDYSRVDVETNM